MNVERRRRSIVKVISWRFTATVTTMVISFVITGNIDFAVKIGGLELVTKIVLQYLHERIWNRSRFGIQVQPMDYQI